VLNHFVNLPFCQPTINIFNEGKGHKLQDGEVVVMLGDLEAKSSFVCLAKCHVDENA
jgi:hypothetical protein